MLSSELLTGIDFECLERNLSIIRKNIALNCSDKSKPVRLIAVTKTVAPDVINRLLKLGVCDIAENRVQVALPKLCHLEPDYRLHWIGRLQTNKVKQILPHISMLHSLDRIELAQEVNRRAAESERELPVLIQVNIAGESQKAGLSPNDLLPFIQEIHNFSGIHIKGLMAIMPIDAEEAELKHFFHGMKILFDNIRQKTISNVDMEELSMGMSRDYPLAVQEGATMVRIGTALYL